MSGCDCTTTEDPTLRALIAILKLACLITREHLIMDDDILSVERLQFFHYARKEFMFDDGHIEEFRSELFDDYERVRPTAI